MAPPIKLSKEDQAALDAANARTKTSSLSAADQAALDAANSSSPKKKEPSTSSSTALPMGSGPSFASSGATPSSASLSTGATNPFIPNALQQRTIVATTPPSAKPLSETEINRAAFMNASPFGFANPYAGTGHEMDVAMPKDEMGFIPNSIIQSEALKNYNSNHTTSI
jgi:hypothetical protein